MTRCLLDANVTRSPVNHQPAANLSNLQADRRNDGLLVSSLIVAGLRFGFLQPPVGRQWCILEPRFEGRDGSQELYAGRIPAVLRRSQSDLGPVDGGTRGRLPRSTLNMIADAVSEAHGCIVAAYSESDFRGIRIVSPMRQSASCGAQRQPRPAAEDALANSASDPNASGVAYILFIWRKQLG